MAIKPLLLQQNFNPSPATKILINIGALLDIPNGTFLLGKYGESILNGGLGMLTGVVGIGNNFKSTLLHYMMLAAADRIAYAVETTMGTYDTEVNTHESRLASLARRFKNLAKLAVDFTGDLFHAAIWVVTDKTVYYANEWYQKLKEFLANKRKNGKDLMMDTPFLERDKKSLMQIIVPTFGQVDSLSEFEPASVGKMQDENEIGESGNNTLFMRAGLAKSQFLMDLPSEIGNTSHFMLVTAHIGKEMAMATGPIPQAPVKKLQYLKNGDKIKGVSDKFFFLMSNCYQAYNAAPFINQGTKGPEYPASPEDNKPLDTDLMIVSVRQLRSKSGTSGYNLELIVSQTEGVLPSLTEFHYLKENDRYGIDGTIQHYSLDLLPEVKLSRTTVRNKIDNDPKLRRALNITAEMCQMEKFWRGLDPLLHCSAKELYEGIKEQGYDWDFILEHTRGWWTLENDKQAIPFLSTMDLLKMRHPKGHHYHYFPYWMADDKKSIKKEFQPK